MFHSLFQLTFFFWFLVFFFFTVVLFQADEDTYELDVCMNIALWQLVFSINTENCAFFFPLVIPNYLKNINSKCRASHTLKFKTYSFVLWLLIQCQCSCPTVFYVLFGLVSIFVTPLAIVAFF